MNRQMLLRHLTLTERHVVAGEVILSRQRMLVDWLEGLGHPAVEALNLLAVFEAVQAAFIADRDRLLADLQFDAAGVR